MAPLVYSNSVRLLNGANPDIWAVAFYGPPTFRDALETLPEALPDGAPAPTFSGAAYWLIHHLRDPEGALKLTLNSQSAHQFDFTLSNSSTWLDLAPVLRARFDGERPAGLQIKWKLGERDVTKQVNGEGLVFNRDLRLNPGDSRELTLEIKRGMTSMTQQKVAPFLLQLELMPHASTPIVKQSQTSHRPSKFLRTKRRQSSFDKHSRSPSANKVKLNVTWPKTRPMDTPPTGNKPTLRRSQ